MNKKEFIDQLEQELHFLNNADRTQQIGFYEEMIADYMEDGCTEEEAVARLGRPKNIARELIDQQELIQTKTMSTPGKIAIGCLLILGFPLWGSLLFAALMIVLSIYIVILCVPFTLAVCAAAFFVVALLGVIGAFPVMTVSMGVGVTQFGVGIISLGISGLCLLGTTYFMKGFWRVSSKFTSKLIGIFKRKEVYKYEA